MGRIVNVSKDASTLRSQGVHGSNKANDNANNAARTKRDTKRLLRLASEEEVKMTTAKVSADTRPRNICLLHRHVQSHTYTHTHTKYKRYSDTHVLDVIFVIVVLCASSFMLLLSSSPLSHLLLCLTSDRYCCYDVAFDALAFVVVVAPVVVFDNVDFLSL